jgi:hypothetical protein
LLQCCSRDLKPSNCFFMGDGTVKVGDFGLSRSAADVALNGGPARAPAAQGLGGAALGGAGVSPPDTPQQRAVSSDSVATASSRQGMRWGDGDITSGVGTLLYASPEQTAGGDYDEKTDVYSLGIMLFEMCHPAFGTGMERAVVLRNLQRQLLPQAWQVQTSHPLVADLLLAMLAPTPRARPSASQVALAVKGWVVGSSGGPSPGGGGVLSLLHDTHGRLGRPAQGAHLFKLHVEVDLDAALQTTAGGPRGPLPAGAAAAGAASAGAVTAETAAAGAAAAGVSGWPLAPAAPEVRSLSAPTAAADHRQREPSAEAKHQIRAAIVGAAPRVRIEQYLLRESGSAALMEFALADLDAVACTKVTNAVAALPFVRKVFFV